MPAVRSIRTLCRSELGCFALAATGAVALTAAVDVKTPGVLPLFGAGIHPIELVPVALAGGVALRSLGRRGWVPTRAADEHRAAEVLVGAAVLASAAIAVDVIHPFARDTNVGWPDAFATYPVVAFMAEAVLHLIPVATLSAVLERHEPPLGWTVVVPAAGLEAAFQVLASSINRWFVGPHLLVIGLYQLRLFRRHGFGAMLAFRLVYYLLWHVLWGRARLDVLF